VNFFKSIPFFLTLLAPPAFPATLRPFATDGCTFVAEGPRENPDLWRDCCVVHDAFYWMGGSFLERIEADDHFKQCLELRTGEFRAILMRLGVRIGGSPFIPTSARWGFGWKGKPFYFILDSKDKLLVGEKLREQEVLTPLQTYEIEEFRQLP
jgi:hypothetical protein